MSNTFAPFATLSDDDKSPVVLVYASIGFFLSVLITGVRIWVTIRGKLTFKSDDFLVFAALAFAIASAVTIGYAENAGLGRHMASLTAANIERYYKFSYASRISAVLAMGLSKASVLMLYRRIDIYQNSQKWFYALVSVILFWTLFSALSIAFQCRTPHLWQWEFDKCPQGVNYFYAIGLMNILTDVLIVLYVIPGFWKLNMAKALRLIVIFLFSFRFCVAAAAIAGIVLLKRITDWSDITWATTAWATVDNVTLNLAIITANIPRVHSFLAQLQTGQIVLQISENDQINNWRSTLRNHYSRVVGSVTASAIEPTQRPTHSPLNLRPAPPAVLRTQIYSTNFNSHTNRPSESSSEGVKHWALGSEDPESAHTTVDRAYDQIAVDVEIHRKESNHGILNPQKS